MNTARKAQLAARLLIYCYHYQVDRVCKLVVTPIGLLSVPDNIAVGRLVNRIQLEEATAVQARKILGRMPAIYHEYT